MKVRVKTRSIPIPVCCLVNINTKKPMVEQRIDVIIARKMIIVSILKEFVIIYKRIPYGTENRGITTHKLPAILPTMNRYLGIGQIDRS